MESAFLPCSGCFPKFLKMLQAARNAPGHISRSENEVQVMLRILASASELQRSCDCIDWGAVARQVKASKPPCEEDIDDLVGFVAVCAGGLDGQFLLDLAAFHRHCVDSSQRKCRGWFFKAVANMSFGSSVSASASAPASSVRASAQASAPLLKIALVKTQYSCPAEGVKRSECQWLTSADVKKFIVNAELAMKTERVLRDTRVALTAAGLLKMPECDRVVLVSKLDTQVIRVALGKLGSSKTSFGSLEHVAQSVAKEAVSKGLAAEPLAKLLAHVEPSASAQAPAPVSAPLAVMRLCEVTSDGRADALTTLRENGFDLGASVASASYTSTAGRQVTVYRIVNATQDLVILTGDEDAEPQKLELQVDDFLEQYRICDTSTIVKLNKQWPSNAPGSKLDHSIAAVVGLITHAIRSAASALPDSASAFDILEKPSRAVRVKQAMAKGALCLIPEPRPAIKVRHPNTQPPAAKHFKIGLSSQVLSTYMLLGYGYEFYVVPNVSKDFVCPAFHVETTASADSANMAWTYFPVTVCIVLQVPAATRQSLNQDSFGAEHKVEVPVLVNTKALLADDNLCFFQAPVPQAAKKRAEVVTISKVQQKRAKITSA